MNRRTEIKYWDEGNKNLVRWYKKGKWKRVFRKRYFKKYFKQINYETI